MNLSMASGYCMETLAERVFKFGEGKFFYRDSSQSYRDFADGSYLALPSATVIYVGVKRV